jgi:hypothetical protein
VVAFGVKETEEETLGASRLRAPPASVRAKRCSRDLVRVLEGVNVR